MTKVYPLVVKKSLVSWIFAKNKKLQLLLVIAAIVSVFTNVLPLEMQKRIVNEAINLKKFDLLYLYCAIYLGAFVTASGLKFLINSLQTVIGQRTVADMRKELYHHILTLPLSFYRRTQPGLVVAALTSELATSGDFVGMAVAVPVTNLLMLFAFAGYLLWLNPLLAAMTLGIYPIVLLLVPLLQKRVNIYNRKRVDTTRKVSGKIAESIAGIHEIQANGAFSIEDRKFAILVKKLRKIRIIWRLLRYGIKVTNSLFTNFSRFLVFALGGYLAINGRLELGALVAFLSAQEKLYTPWKELIDFYQVYQTSSVTYNRTMEYFDLEPEHALYPEGRDPIDLDGSLAVKDLSFVTEDGTKLLSNITFSLKPGEHMALVGFSGSGKSTLAQCIIQLYKYASGQILMGNHEVAQLSKIDITNNTGFVSQTPFIFEGTFEENLLYACAAKTDRLRPDEKGNMPSLDDRILVLQQTGLFVDGLRFGLEAVLDKDKHEKMVEQILDVRKTFRQDFAENMRQFIEIYDQNNYLHHSSVADNLMFGEPRRNDFAVQSLPRNEHFLGFLDETRLTMPLLDLGIQLIDELIQLSDSRSFEKEILEVGLIGPDEIDDYKKLMHNVKRKGTQKVYDRERRRLLQVALDFTPQKHKLMQLPEKLEDQILEGRRHFRKKIFAEAPDAISFYHMSAYMPTQSILTNIFFGKLKDDSSEAQDQINTCIHQLLIKEDFWEDIIEMGMQYKVGRKGENLSGGQRQKLAIARVFLKNPPILIMDEATSGLDNESQARIQGLLENRWKGKSTLVSIVHRLDIIKNYDRIAVMKGGKIVEMGTYDELMSKNSILSELVSGG